MRTVPVLLCFQHVQFICDIAHIARQLHFQMSNIKYKWCKVICERCHNRFWRSLQRLL